MANLQQHFRLPVPARVLALEKMPEEFLLQPNAVICVEMRPVLDAMHFEPFLLGSRANETLEISARMQALSAPVCRGEEGRLHLSPVRHARLPVGISVELARDTVFVEVAAVATKLFFRKRFRPRHPVAIHAALETTRAAPVLH